VCSDGFWRTIRGTAWHDNIITKVAFTAPGAKFSTCAKHLRAGCRLASTIPNGSRPLFCIMAAATMFHHGFICSPATFLRSAPRSGTPFAFMRLKNTTTCAPQTISGRFYHHDFRCWRGASIGAHVNQDALLGDSNGICSLQTSTGHITCFCDSVRAPSVTVNFGKIIRGYIELAIDSPAGARLEIGYTENLVNRHFNNALPLRRRHYSQGGRNTYRSFCWIAFRYIKLFAAECAQREIRFRGTSGFQRFP
jgi:hypothetical protein